jgi:two-component system cell cycle sensor histidine kinase PleC
MKEIFLPIVSMTITLAAVYAPIGFTTGLTGSLFREFAFTLAGAVIISGIVAVTLSPMMSSKLLKGHGGGKLKDEEIVQYAGLIHDAAGHLLAVINDILDISKMRSGAFALDAFEVDLSGVIQDCAEAAKTAADEAGVELLQRISFTVPPVRGDDVKLAQIFNNLLSNAIKFTPRGGSVTIEALGLGNGGVKVVVRDTGIGMTPEEISVAVEPFGQVDGAKTRWREGAGLGLPIAKALAELHGGQLLITSVKGKGTDVTITLPPAHQVSAIGGRDAVFGHGAVV